MALVKATLKAAIVSALNVNMTSVTPTADQTKQVNDLAGAISDAVDAYIKSATITVPMGIPVSTAGSPSAQTGATTAPATATIS
jgi:hypothetical protein